MGCWQPNAYYNPHARWWCKRYGHLGQGAVMGLLSTIFAWQILMSMLGSVMT